MNIHIINKVNLPLRIVADVLDRWRDSSKEDTQYVGKLYWIDFEYDHKEYSLEIEIKKKCLSIIVK
ncbi:MAG: hypothetical protein MJ245_00395 [Clostridia bacterium]|nr:hypothetical protein [Clostridia bacterium]